MTTPNTTADRIVWVDPSIVTLDVAETANRPRKGSDGGAQPDCSKS